MTERYMVYMHSGSSEMPTEREAHLSACSFVALGARNVRVAHERSNTRGGFDTLSVEPIYSLGEPVTLKDGRHWTARPTWAVVSYGLSSQGIRTYLLRNEHGTTYAAKWSDVDGLAQEERDSAQA